MAGDSSVIFKVFGLSQLLTLVGYLIVTVGYALLQVRVNNLPLWRGLDEKALAETREVYNDVFKQTQYIIPYAKDSGYQFQYQWWIIQLELMTFLMTFPLMLFPKYIERVRPVALTFITACMVMVMDNINAVVFLMRNDTAKEMFQTFRIEWTLAGLILLTVANFLTVISVGLYKHGYQDSFDQHEFKTSLLDSSRPTETTVDITKAQVREVQKSGPELCLFAKLAHAVALLVAAVIAILVGAALGDGASVVHLKHASYLPRLTELSLKEKGLDYRADELLGPKYGVGLHHDSSGYTWTEAGAGATLKKYVEELGLPQVIAAVPSVVMSDGLKHPAQFLSCASIKNSGLSAMSFAIIAEVVCFLMIIFHGLALLGFLPGLVSAKVTKAISVLVWFVLAVGTLIVCCIAISIYFDTHSCDNPFVPTITLADHFDYSWAFPIAWIGYISAALVFVLQLFLTPLNLGDAITLSKKLAVQIVGALLVWLTIGAIMAVGVGGGVGQFDSAPAPDPNVNPCEGQKPYHAGLADGYFSNVECMKDGIVQVLEQAGADVTRGYVGGLDAGEWRVPITESYDMTDLCPVNVHWHLGAEHRSAGEYDEQGTGPVLPEGYCPLDGRRKLAAEECTRLGHRCHHYDAADAKFTTEYDWKHCTDMHVGETYEVHWPHSAAGACGTEWQYQTPFYDGVFCNDGIINILTPLNTYKKIGVQGQTFVIVNDEAYYHDNLISGMIVGEEHGADMAMYTGSTTGTSRDNDVCSRYAPITWQVDRKCHMVSASSFDKMCKDMKAMKDDMSGDLYPHGSRETVAHHLTANNQQS